MTDAVSIRPARLDDAPSIVEFNAALALESEGRALDRALLVPGVAAVLADANKGRYYIAELDGGVVGQTMITWEWSDWRNGTFWWIQSVYVRPTARRRGVFSALYRHIHAAARADAAVCGIRLYMEDHNHRARDTYLALGMQRGGYQVLEVDFRAPAPVSA